MCRSGYVNPITHLIFSLYYLSYRQIDGSAPCRPQSPAPGRPHTLQ